MTKAGRKRGREPVADPTSDDEHPALSATKRTDQRTWPSIIAEVGKAGPVGALALVLLALGAGLAIWFVRANSSSERIIAGVAFVVVLLAVAGALLSIEWMRLQAPSREFREAAETLDKAGVSAEEIERIRVSASEKSEELIPGPDASFIVRRPPAGWVVEVTNVPEFLKEFSHGSEKHDQVFASDLRELESFLRIEYGARQTFAPQPGRTRLNGALQPIFLTGPLVRGLWIMSRRRRAPPLYMDQSLYDTIISVGLFDVLFGMMSIKSITPGRLPKTGREMVVAEATSNLEGVLVDGGEVDVQVNTRISAVRGDAFDYLLLAMNFRIGGESDGVAESVDDQIRILLDSFLPLSIADPSKETRVDGKRAEQGFEEFMTSETGDTLFWDQFHAAWNQLRGMDLHSRSDMQKGVSLLRPFRSCAHMLRPFSDGERDPKELWDAFDQAEKGQTQPLRDLLLKRLELPPTDEGPPRAFPS